MSSPSNSEARAAATGSHASTTAVSPADSERCAAVNAQNAATVSQLLFELPAITGASLVLATHDKDLAEKASVRFALVQGVLQAL